MKRLVYLLSIIGAVAAVILVGYFLRYRASEPSPQTPSTGTLPSVPVTGTTQPQTGETSGEEQGRSTTLPTVSFAGQKFGVVAQNPVADFFVDDQNNAILIQPDGKIIKIVQTESLVLSSSAVDDLLNAEFSNDGTRALIAFGDKANPQHSIFDIENKTWEPQSTNIKSATWSPSGNQIAYFSEKNGVNALTTLDTSTNSAKPKELIRIFAEDLSIKWLNQNQIILSEKGSALSSASIWNFNPEKKTFSTLIEDEFGLDSIWSEEVGRGLVLITDLSRRGGKLSLTDITGNTLNNLSLLTLPSKCVFNLSQVQGDESGQESSTSTPATPLKSLYCAIPRDSQALKNSPLPDLYQKKGIFTADDFYKIDVDDGSIDVVFAEQAMLVDAINLKIFNQTLFFINRLDQKLYAISLKKPG